MARGQHRGAHGRWESGTMAATRVAERSIRGQRWNPRPAATGRAGEGIECEHAVGTALDEEARVPAVRGLASGSP